MVKIFVQKTIGRYILVKSVVSNDKSKSKCIEGNEYCIPEFSMGDYKKLEAISWS